MSFLQPALKACCVPALSCNSSEPHRSRMRCPPMLHGCTAPSRRCISTPASTTGARLSQRSRRRGAFTPLDQPPTDAMPHTQRLRHPLCGGPCASPRAPPQAPRSRCRHRGTSYLGTPFMPPHPPPQAARSRCRHRGTPYSGAPFMPPHPPLQARLLQSRARRRPSRRTGPTGTDARAAPRSSAPEAARCVGASWRR